MWEHAVGRRGRPAPRRDVVGRRGHRPNRDRLPASTPRAASNPEPWSAPKTRTPTTSRSGDGRSTGRVARPTDVAGRPLDDSIPHPENPPGGSALDIVYPVSISGPRGDVSRVEDPAEFPPPAGALARRENGPKRLRPPFAGTGHARRASWPQASNGWKRAFLVTERPDWRLRFGMGRKVGGLGSAALRIPPAGPFAPGRRRINQAGEPLGFFAGLLLHGPRSLFSRPPWPEFLRGGIPGLGPRPEVIPEAAQWWKPRVVWPGVLPQPGDRVASM